MKQMELEVVYKETSSGCIFLASVFGYSLSETSEFKQDADIVQYDTNTRAKPMGV